MGEPAIRPCTESEFEAVVRLGDRYKRYLGLYPREAYLVSIRAGCIYGAFYQDELIGYVLFALPYADVRLIHLCVDPGYRNAGLARRLIDEIQKRHGDRQGIRLKCRRDYPAHKVWPRLGFQAESLTQGRGKDKAEMTVWRRSFGHADLFSSWLADDPRVQVALDTNVIMDVLLRRNQETEEFLDSPVLQGEVSYCISRSVRNELSELQPPSERQRVMSRLAQFEELSSELRACDTLHEELVQGLSSVDLAKDHSLRADARLLAETIVSGASVLVTRDDNAATLLRPLAQQHGVDILHPSQLILMIDELKGVRRDGTERLQNTELTLGGASAGIDRELDHLVSTHSGETKSQFRKIVRSKMASDIKIVHTADSRLADGVVVTNTVNGNLEVELLRVRRTPLSAALLKQLLFQLRHEAMSRGASRIVLTDPAPGGGESYVGILEQEGAKLINGCWTIEVVDVQLDLSVLRAGLSPWNLSAWLDGGLETPEDFAMLEHQLWPLKVRSAPLHCYVVPIKQSFASELLGYDAPLLTRRRDLGISRRHVYYKSAPYKPAAPGRILWYVSGRRGGSIVASSQLISSHRGSPGALHKRFHKYGVWTQTDIEAHATRTGEAVALRFGDTEIFRSFIKLSHADAIVSAHGRALSTVPTVREIPDAAFHEIYSRGMNQ